nr:Mu transposase C-terminal domain-containing protein [Methylosinus sp. RM1]
MELVGCYEDRKAERRGIRIFGLRYNCRELAMFRAGFQKDPRVEVRYDPDNLGKVWVIDSKNGRALPIPCTRPDYAEGLSLNQHRIIRAHAVSRYGGRKILMKELLLSRAELFALGQKMIGSVKSGRKRKKLAHFFGADRSILDAYTYRGEDPETSKGHILDGDSAPSGQADNDARGFDIHSDIDDPEDDTQARRDEAFVDSVVDGEPNRSDPPAARRKAGRPAARRNAGRPAASASTGERVEDASASSTAPAESRPETREPPRPVPPAPPPAPRAAPEAPEPRRDAPKRPRVLTDDD